MTLFHTMRGQKKNFFFQIPEIPKNSADIFPYYEYVLYVYLQGRHSNQCHRAMERVDFLPRPESQ